MLVIPAIDIKDGNVVRLERGDFTKVKIYSNDPVSVAKEFQAQGAKLLHVVDLDGAFSGELKNLALVRKISKAVSIPIQLGGGIRTQEAIDSVLSLGINRVILGTRACEDEAFIQSVITGLGEKIVVSIDAKDGMVATDGWKNVSKVKATDLVKKLELFGLKILIYTDIARDGMLGGPNIESLKEILNARDKAVIISSGGISSFEDLLKLKMFESQGLLGAIVGKAVYEKKFNLKEAIEKC